MPPSPVTTTPSPSPPDTFSPPAPEASPNAEYSKSCDYILGDFSEHTNTGFRFVAGAEITNSGNIGVVVEVVATFKQLGSDPIRLKKTAKIPTGATKQVGFTDKVGQQEINLIQAAQDQGSICNVKATIVDTYGEPR